VVSNYRGLERRVHHQADRAGLARVILVPIPEMTLPPLLTAVLQPKAASQASSARRAALRRVVPVPAPTPAQETRRRTPLTAAPLPKADSRASSAKRKAVDCLAKRAHLLQTQVLSNAIWTPPPLERLLIAHPLIPTRHRIIPRLLVTTRRLHRRVILTLLAARAQHSFPLSLVTPPRSMTLATLPLLPPPQPWNQPTLPQLRHSSA